MKNPFSIVKDFEDAVAEYCDAPYCVAVNSCTNALFLSLIYHKQRLNNYSLYYPDPSGYIGWVNIPKHTYVSVPQQIMHAGFDIKFREEDWKGLYQIKPLCIWDSARRFTSGMFKKLNFVSYEQPVDYICVSFHWTKILGVQQGGAILHNDPQFDTWARKARFDGRTEGMAPKDDNIDMLGWHMYMSPEVAAEGLVRLHHLPKRNADLPNDDYPDLSKMSIFQ